MHTLISIILALAVFGFCWWLLGRIPMPQVVHAVITFLCIFALVLFPLDVTGLYHAGWLR